jgi:hypothetical protein
VEIVFTEDELLALRSAGSNIGGFLNRSKSADLRKRVFKYTAFLPDNAVIIQRCWHVVNNIGTSVKCEGCYTASPKWSYDDKGYRKFCSIKCSRKQSVITGKETCLRKYGVDNPLKVKSIKDKVSATIEERYGTKWYCSTDDCQSAGAIYLSKNKDEIVLKRNSTNLERFGNIYPTSTSEIKIKTIATNLERYGVPYSSQNSGTRELARETSIERFGVPYAVQNAKIHDKNMRSGRKYREYVFPSGKIAEIQGWENKALDLLLKDYAEEDIVTERLQMPAIWYYNNDRKHRYYPDIYIPKENRIIEVKSVWTYTNSLEINLLKENATKEAGYNFEFMIF